MSATSDRQPNLREVSDQIRELSTKVDRLATDVESFNDKVAAFNDKFDNYQKATQWVVQLAFTLIASATITVILSTIFR